MVITKDILKQEIDRIQDEYVIILYDVIKAFERPIKSSPSTRPTSRDQWEVFLEKFAGCFAETPLCRGDQGTYEVREPLQ